MCTLICRIFRHRSGQGGDQTTLGIRAKKVRLEADPPQKVVVDGEVLGNTPVDVEIIPGWRKAGIEDGSFMLLLRLPRCLLNTGSLVVLAPLPSAKEEKDRAVAALTSELGKLEMIRKQAKAGSSHETILERRIRSIKKQIVQQESVDTEKQEEHVNVSA